MASFSTTSLTKALKTYYNPKVVQDLIYKKSPTLALIKKDENATGSTQDYLVNFQASQSESPSFAEAQASSNGPALARFSMTTVESHSVKTIEQKVALQLRNDAGGFMKAGISANDDAILNISQGISRALFRSGWGDIGRIKSRSGSTITLTNADDTFHFPPGKVVVFSDTLGSSVLRDSGDSLVVLGSNISTGVVTFTTAVSNISGLADGDYVFTKGARENVASPSRLVLTGLGDGGWIPSSVTPSESFFGVDRSVDSRLQGVFQNGAYSSIEDSMVDLCMNIHKISGGKCPDKMATSYSIYAQLLKNMSASVVRDSQVKVQNLSFDSVKLITPGGMVDVFVDPHCPTDQAFAINTDSLKLTSMGPLITRMNDDGIESLRAANSNDIEFRYYSYHQLYCTAPCWNGRILFA